MAEHTPQPDRPAHLLAADRGTWLAVGLLAASVTAARVARGISLSDDSLVYLDAASRWQPDAGLRMWDGSPLTTFPPLYPWCLARLGALVGTPARAASVLAVATIFGAAVASFSLLRHAGLRRAVAAMLTLLVFLHPQMQTVFWFAWSDGPYVLLSLVLLWLLARTRASGLEAWAALAGLVSGLGFLTRYVGLALLPTTVVGIACVSGASVARRVRASVIALAIAGTCVAAWVLRNHAADGTWLGPRSASVDTLGSALVHVAAAAGAWMLPVRALSGLAPVVGTLGIVAIAVPVLRACLRARDEMRPVAPSLAFVLLHTMALVHAQRTTTMDPIDTRLTSPALGPVVLVLAWSLQHRDAGQWRSHARRIALAGAVLLFASDTIWTARWIHTPPFGWAAFALSPADLPHECRVPARPVYSNAPAYLHYAGDVDAPRPLPRAEVYRTGRRRDDWAAFVRALTAREACLVWFGSATEGPPRPDVVLGGDPGPVRLQTVSERRGMSFFVAGTAVTP